MTAPSGPQHSLLTDLSTLSFGRLDAESDKKLNEYFLDTGTVASVEHGAKMVVGRKGSGKTALFRYLPTQLPSEVIQLDLDDYVWEYHKAFRAAGMTGPQSYLASWKLVIYLAVYARLRGKLESAERRTIEEALRRIGVDSESGFLPAIWNWLKRIEKVDLPAVEGVFDAGSLDLSESKESPFSNAVTTQIEAIGMVLVGVALRLPFTVLIDRLDDAWDGTSESLDLIAGAVRATRALGLESDEGSPAPVVTFLRTDLWDSLSYNVRNKMSQDTIYLDWSVEELLSVIDLRIAQTSGLARSEGWAAVFSREEMRQRASAQTYISKRAMGRPRDIVAFCIFALAEARKNKNPVVLPADIYEAEKRYSRHVLDEMKDELDRHIQKFPQVISALKSLRNRNFSMTGWLDATQTQGIVSADARNILNQLIGASAVGVHAAGGSKGGSQTVYQYQDRHLQAVEGATMQVHLALVKELGLKDA